MLKTNQKRSQIAITLIWICLIVNLISLFSSYLQFQLLTQLSKGVEIANYKLEQNDSREQLVGIVTLIVIGTSIPLALEIFKERQSNRYKPKSDS